MIFLPRRSIRKHRRSQPLCRTLCGTPEHSTCENFFMVVLTILYNYYDDQKLTISQEQNSRSLQCQARTVGLRALSYILSWWTKQNNKLIIDSTLLEILKKNLMCSFMHFKKRHPPGAQRKDQISKGGTMALKEDMQDVHCKKKNNSCLAV